MNLTISFPEIEISNSMIVFYFVYFITSAFISYAFKQSNLFFKFFVFFIAIGYIQFLWNGENIYATLSSLAGFIFIYRDVISEFFSSIFSFFDNVFYRIKSFFSSIFSSVAGFFYLIFRVLQWFFNFLAPIFRWIFTRRESPRSKEKRENSETKSSWWGKYRADKKDESVNQAKEDLKRAREEAKKREEQERAEKDGKNAYQTRSDNRSFEEILGLPSPFSKSELNRAYKTAVSRYHPDKYVHMSEQFQQEAQQEFVKIQKAYNYLLGRVSDD